MNREIKIYENAFLLSDDFAEEFRIKSKQYSRNKKNLNVAISGGNTPITIFEILSLHYGNKINWRNIQFYWTDERCVPPDNNDSNYGMTKKFLLDNIKIPEDNIHRIKGEEGPFGEVSRYSDELLSNVPLINHFPSLDLIILGLGEDGHTASIFPDNLQAMKSKKVCEVTYNSSTRQRRITLTAKVINNSKNIYFIVTGRKKAEIVYKILKRKKGYKKFPASHINPVNGKINWMLDSYAAALLNEQK